MKSLARVSFAAVATVLFWTIVLTTVPVGPVVAVGVIWALIWRFG